MQSQNISWHKLPDFCEDGLMLICGIICLLQHVYSLPLSTVCYFGFKWILKTTKLFWRRQTYYQHNIELYKWMKKMFMYAKWKLWKKESQTNKQPHIGREMKTTVTHLVTKCICISTKWASCCCAKEYPSVPEGAIDGNGVTVHKFLDWITLYNSVENSWFGGCQTYQLTSLFCLVFFFNTNTWKTNQ